MFAFSESVVVAQAQSVFNESSAALDDGEGATESSSLGQIRTARTSAWQASARHVTATSCHRH